MRLPHRILSGLFLLLAPYAAFGGLLVIEDGDTFLVMAGEQLMTQNVVVNGTFRNQGEVIHNGLFENFGLTDNQGLFRNLGEFRSYQGLHNSGEFINEGSFINSFGIFESTGTFSSSGHMEIHWQSYFSELNVSGVLENHDYLETSGNSTHLMTGTLTNVGLWGNSGHLQLGQTGVTGGTLRNTGEFLNAGLLEVTAAAVLTNTGLLTNRQDLVIDGRLVNEGELINDSTWVIDYNGVPVSSMIANSGTIRNSRVLTVNSPELTLEGEWINESSMNLNVDFLRVDGALRTHNLITHVSGDVEIAPGGTVEQRGTWTEIDGRLVNHGTAWARLSTFSAASVENHGTLRIDSQMVAGQQYIQYDGSTVMGMGSGIGVLVSSHVQVYGGLLAADESFGTITGFPPSADDTLVEIFGGTISGGAQRLNIFGDLILYDQATMAATLRNDDGLTRVGDVALNGDMTLAGTLIVDLGLGALVEPGDVWTLASASSISGMFSDIIFPSVAGIDFELFILLDNFLQLHAVQAVPLPLPLVLFLSATCLLFRFRKV